MRNSDRRGYLALSRLEEFATWREALGYAKEELKLRQIVKATSRLDRARIGRQA